MEPVNKDSRRQLSPEQLNRKVGMFLRLRRESLGLTGEQLGKMMYLSQQQISRYERGVNALTLHQLNIMLELVGSSWDEFFHEVITEQPCSKIESLLIEAQRDLTSTNNIRI